MSQVLTEQLDSLFEQTTASHISEVWVCVFSAPAQDYALRVVKESKYRNVRLVVSDFNFKFYGRFQVYAMIRAFAKSFWLGCPPCSLIPTYTAVVPTLSPILKHLLHVDM